jgi:hypothetical protein
LLLAFHFHLNRKSKLVPSEPDIGKILQVIKVGEVLETSSFGKIDQVTGIIDIARCILDVRARVGNANEEAVRFSERE